jgi:hypothetical protein
LPPKILLMNESMIFLPNVKGDAAAHGTLNQLWGFSPSPQPACSVSVGGNRRRSPDYGKIVGIARDVEQES